MEKKRIISLGIAGLSLALAASITSTVAWYTGSTYLAITDINIKLKDPELQISTDNVHFSDKISSRDLIRMEHFTAVSSMFSNEWLANREETPVFKDGYPVGLDYVMNDSSDYSNASGGYFSQTFYLKCDLDSYITLDKENTTFVPDEESNEEMLRNEGFMNTMRGKYQDLSESELKEMVLSHLNNVVNSLRISILVIDDEPDDEYDDYKYYIYDPNKNGDTLLGGILDTTDSGYYNTYNSKEILYGQTYSSNPNNTVDDCIVYDNALLAATTEHDRKDMTCFVANNALGDRKINFPQSYENGLVIEKEHSLDASQVENELLIPISSRKTRKIVLSFYQEGWDLDNTNFIVYSQFFINVLFMIAPVKPRL